MTVMKTMFVDVMCKGRFLFTFRYRYCPAFKVDMQDVYEKILQSRPSLRGKRLELFVD